MQANQTFIISQQLSGFYTIRAKASGLNLGIRNGVLSSGTVIEQQSSSQNSAQLWSITENSDGSICFSSALSSSYAMEVKNGSDSNLAAVQLAASTGARAQKFFLIPLNAVHPSEPAVLPNGVYTIACIQNPRMLIDNPNFSTKTGEQLIVWSQNGGNNQFFGLTYSDGYYRIRNDSSMLAMEVSAGNRVSGTALVQSSPASIDRQGFTITSNTDGSYTIWAKVGTGNPASDLVVTAIPSNGSMLTMAPYTSASNQRFEFKQLTDTMQAGDFIEICPRYDRSMRFDVLNNLKTNGAQISTWVTNGGMNQRFEVVQAGTDTIAFKSLLSGSFLTVSGNTIVQQSGVAPNAYQSFKVGRIAGGYQLMCVANNSFLSASKGGALTVTTNSSNASTLFYYTQTQPLANGFYRLYTPNGLYMSVSGDSKSDAATIQLISNSTKTDFNIWYITYNKGSLRLENGVSFKSLDIYGASAADGASMIQWPYHGNSNQVFLLVPSGDGWFYIKTGMGTYVASSGSGATGSKLYSTTDINKAQKFRSETAPQPRPYIGSYIDLNLSTQRLMIIRDGYVVFSCDVVTGATRSPTPTGTFYIMSKGRNVNLRGPTWNSWVQYWAQFTNNGCGFHDAYWQSSFGLERWRAGYGSHGCVNMSLADAERFYNLVSVGDRVVVHY